MKGFLGLLLMRHSVYFGHFRMPCLIEFWQSWLACFVSVLPCEVLRGWLFFNRVTIGRRNIFGFSFLLHLYFPRFD